MAINRATFASEAPITQPALAAPTTSETVTGVQWGTILEFEVGGTATTTTIIRPGTHAQGDNVTDYVVGGGALTSTRRALRLYPFRDANGDVAITWSQVTAVLARVWDT